ncbi:MAG: hypothetical protein L6Q35_04820 [Phycisphaerales bacterium]|nr:hypothetical protein [Phycisphaerales bacterium]
MINGLLLLIWIVVWGLLTVNAAGGPAIAAGFLIVLAACGVGGTIGASVAGVEHRAHTRLLLVGGAGFLGLVAIPLGLDAGELVVLTFVWACGSLFGAMVTAKRKIGNYCLRCGYPTDGLTASTCPECGATVKSADADTTA